MPGAVDAFLAAGVPANKLMLGAWLIMAELSH